MERLDALIKAARAAIGIAAIVGCGSAHADLIVNGNFSLGLNDGIVNPPGWVITPGEPHVAHRGASPAQFELFWFGAGTTAENGPGIIAFNAGDSAPIGAISQTFGTVPGASYTLKFDFGVTGFLEDEDNFQQLAVVVLGSDGLIELLAPQLISDTNDKDISTDNSLTTFTYQFTADGNQATVRFSDVEANRNRTVSRDGVLDNVSVTGPAPVPEPLTILLVGVGLAALGFRRSYTT